MERKKQIVVRKSDVVVIGRKKHCGGAFQWYAQDS